MSTVLWANYLSEGIVTSDESDKYALYKHLDTLDSVCLECGVPLLSEACDSTDVRFNMDEIELPNGMESTDELMAQSGTWIDAQVAFKMIEALLSRITSERIRFGLIRNDYEDVVAELEQSAKFVKTAANKQAKFNFSVVM